MSTFASTPHNVTAGETTSGATLSLESGEIQVGRDLLMQGINGADTNETSKAGNGGAAPPLREMMCTCLQARQLTR
jgi:hypothetical protein